MVSFFRFCSACRQIAQVFLRPKFLWRLAFFAVVFLNYLLFLFLKRKTESGNEVFLRMGRLFFSFWFSVLVLIGIARAWFQ